MVQSKWILGLVKEQQGRDNAYSINLNLSEYVPEVSGDYHMEPESEDNAGEDRVKDAE